MNVGDLVRYSGKFLRVIGIFSGSPVNGIVIESTLVGQRRLLTVFWSDDSVSRCVPSNLEPDTANEAMPQGLRRALVEEGLEKLDSRNE
jgi:hypothetical protein